jgi:hypothetical protein
MCLKMKKAAAELPQSATAVLPKDVLPFPEALAQSGCFAERVWAE